MSDPADIRELERKRLAARLAEALAKVSNLSEFSRLTGVDRRALTRYSGGEIEPSATTLLRIARGLNVSIDELAGLSEPRPAFVADAQYIESMEAGQMQMAQSMRILASNDLALVPRLNVRVAAGIGMVNYHERADIEQVPISAALLSRLGVDRRNAHVIQVEGDSMEPGIVDRDDVLINVADDQPRPSGIYAVQYGDEAMLKRVQVIPSLDAVSLISDNERYDPIPVKRSEREQFRVIGRAKLVMRVL